jgi:hypothetical protein
MSHDQPGVTAGRLRRLLRIDPTTMKIDEISLTGSIKRFRKIRIRPFPKEEILFGNLHDDCTTRNSHLIRAIILLFSVLNLFSSADVEDCLRRLSIQRWKAMLVQDVEGS